MVELYTRQAYLDGELCGVGADGITSFNIVQLASDGGNAAALVFFFRSALLDGADLREGPLIERTERRARGAKPALQRSRHRPGTGSLRESLRDACRGHRLKAHRCTLCPWQPGPVAQGQMP